MTQTSKTLEQKIAELQTENKQKLERKIKELTIKEDLLRLTGLDFMVLIHSDKKTSIWVENDQYNSFSKFDRTKIGEYYKAICTILEPIAAPIKVSGGQYENFAPARIDFENYFSEITYGHTQAAKITFTFGNGMDVSFKMPSQPHYGNFSADVIRSKYAELKPENKNTMGKNCYYLAGFGKVNMYGNNYYAYASQPEQVEAFMKVVFTGSN